MQASIGTSKPIRDELTEVLIVAVRAALEGPVDAYDLRIVLDEIVSAIDEVDRLSPGQLKDLRSDCPEELAALPGLVEQLQDFPDAHTPEELRGQVQSTVGGVRKRAQSLLDG